MVSFLRSMCTTIQACASRASTASSTKTGRLGRLARLTRLFVCNYFIEEVMK